MVDVRGLVAAQTALGIKLVEEKHELRARIALLEVQLEAARDAATVAGAELERRLASQTFVIEGEPFTSCSIQALEVLKAADAIPEATLDMLIERAAYGGDTPVSDFAKAERARRKAATKP